MLTRSWGIMNLDYTRPFPAYFALRYLNMQGNHWHICIPTRLPESEVVRGRMESRPEAGAPTIFQREVLPIFYWIQHDQTEEHVRNIVIGRGGREGELATQVHVLLFKRRGCSFHESVWTRLLEWGWPLVYFLCMSSLFFTASRVLRVPRTYICMMISRF